MLFQLHQIHPNFTKIEQKSGISIITEFPFFAKYNKILCYQPG